MYSSKNYSPASVMLNDSRLNATLKDTPSVFNENWVLKLFLIKKITP